MKRLILLFLLALAALPAGLASARERVASGGQKPPPPPPPLPHREVADPVPPTTGDLARVYALSCLWLARLWVLRHLAELGTLGLVAGLLGALRILRRRTVRAAALALVVGALLPGAAARATEPIENHGPAAVRPASEAGPDPDRPTFEPVESPLPTEPTGGEMSPPPTPEEIAAIDAKAKRRLRIVAFVFSALLLGLFVWWWRDDAACRAR